MPKITVNRISGFENRWRKIGLEIDSEKIGEIKNGEILSFDVAPGKHTLQAKIDWCSSNLIEIDVKEHNVFEFELRKGKGFSLYRIIFAPQNYLELLEVTNN